MGMNCGEDAGQAVTHTNIKFRPLLKSHLVLEAMLSSVRGRKEDKDMHFLGRSGQKRMR